MKVLQALKSIEKANQGNDFFNQFDSFGYDLRYLWLPNEEWLNIEHPSGSGTGYGYRNEQIDYFMMTNEDDEF